MTLDFILRNWALALAVILGATVTLVFVWGAWRGSARGRLRSALKQLRRRRREAREQAASARRSAAALERLERRAEAVKPRRLRDAAEAVEDARALLKIAEDQVLIAENHVRRIIVDEFPPRRQDALRRRYRLSDEPDGRPFSF